MGTTLEDDECLISLDVKSLYTNVPVDEAIELATKLAYDGLEPPPFVRAVFQKLLHLALTNVLFKCCGRWYRQTEGLAMGSSLSVVLANIWMNTFEDTLARVEPISARNNPKDNIVPCGGCGENVEDNEKAVLCDGCCLWVHQRCVEDDINLMTDNEYWFCGCTTEIPKRAKIFARYVDDIMRMVKKAVVDTLLKMANSLHRNLEFTIKLESEGALSFLDMKILRHQDSLKTKWFTKPTDTGLMLNFHSLAPTQYKRNVEEGTIHRINHTTTDWIAFHDGVAKAQLTFEQNGYPPQFYGNIVRDTINKNRNVASPINRQDTGEGKAVEKSKERRPLLMLQYRGQESDRFARRLRTHGVSTTFTTRKLKSYLPSLKDPIPEELSSKVIYQIECPGCHSRYVGQTARHVITRLGEHRRKSSPLGRHFGECADKTGEVTATVLHRCTNVNKSLTMETLYIARTRPILNQREEYRSRDLTLNL